MKIDPVIERMRAHDDQATGLASQMIAAMLDGHGICQLHRRIKERITIEAENQDDPIEGIKSLLALVGFWTVIEALEREVREATP